MFSSACLFLVTVLAAATVNAHFQLQFPPPRGAFNEPNEIHLCDGYSNVAANRTEFPLKGGFYSLNSEHPKWTAGVTLSTSQNPQSFDDFDLVNSFFQLQGEGAFCIPLDFSTTNFTLTSGQNVTIEVVFDGGDGMLYQCADLTLSDNFTIPSSVSCTNATGSSSASPTSTAPTSTGSPTGTGSPQSSAALPTYPIVNTAIAALFFVVGLVLA